MSKIPVQPADAAKPFGVWSYAVAVDGPHRLLFISGLTARDERGEVIGIGDIAAQTRQVCENMAKACRAAGGTLADVVSVTVYVRNASEFDAIHKVRREFFASDPPASAMVEVQGLVDKRCLIEMSAIACLRLPSGSES